MTSKPSRNEEEYFTKLEAQRTTSLKKSAQLEAELAERRTHFMRCPRCGGHLTVEHHSGIEVEHCPECHGLWFDEGEAERLVNRNASTGVSGLF